ncbi:MAG: alpha-ketoglutarate-dependent dioxygenase AlkB [Aggregatilineales bacterium]
MCEAINGLRLIGGYVSRNEEKRLLETIDAQSWMTDMKRRVQHYGYRYDYKARRIDESMHIGALPDWAKTLSLRLLCDGFISKLPDQVIINDYQPGQGISPHVDCVPCFEDTVLSLTLGSGCVMTFDHLHSSAHTFRYLNARSLLIISGDARYDWKHGIPARKTDALNGFKITRARRVSITFRSVILESAMAEIADMEREAV